MQAADPATLNTTYAIDTTSTEHFHANACRLSVNEVV